MRAVAALLPLVMAAAAVAQTRPAGPSDAFPYEAGVEAICERCEHLDQKDAAASVKIWPGVIADRGAKTVTILSVATGIAADAPLEFFVAPIDSGKDYEALCVTPAKPSDVDAALRFIGLTPGEPIDPAKNRFWAKGPRLKVGYVVDGKPVTGAVIVDVQTHRPVPAELLFAGSYTRTDPQGEKHYAADAIDARPLAPDYEDPAAVLAVPRRAPQGVVYGFQKRGPAADWKKGGLVDVVLTRDAAANGTERTGHIDVRLNAGHPQYVVTGLIASAKPTDTETFASLPQLVDRLSINDWAVQGGYLRPATVPSTTPGDLFLTVSVGGDVRVNDARKLYGVLQALEQDRGVKLDEPPAGELYARGFFPDPAWHNREDRRGEPWELFLTRDSGKLTGKLERLATDPDGPPGTPPKLSSQAVAGPEAFVEVVNGTPAKWTRSVFVYPPADLTYGELMAWVKPVLPTYPLVFVFPADAAASRPAK